MELYVSQVGETDIHPHAAMSECVRLFEKSLFFPTSDRDTRCLMACLHNLSKEGFEIEFDSKPHLSGRNAFHIQRGHSSSDPILKLTLLGHEVGARKIPIQEGLGFWSTEEETAEERVVDPCHIRSAIDSVSSSSVSSSTHVPVCYQPGGVSFLTTLSLRLPPSSPHLLHFHCIHTCEVPFSCVQSVTDFSSKDVHCRVIHVPSPSRCSVQLFHMGVLQASLPCDSIRTGTSDASILIDLCSFRSYPNLEAFNSPSTSSSTSSLLLPDWIDHLLGGERGAHKRVPILCNMFGNPLWTEDANDLHLLELDEFHQLLSLDRAIDPPSSEPQDPLRFEHSLQEEGGDPNHLPSHEDGSPCAEEECLACHDQHLDAVPEDCHQHEESEHDGLCSVKEELEDVISPVECSLECCVKTEDALGVVKQEDFDVFDLPLSKKQKRDKSLPSSPSSSSSSFAPDNELSHSNFNYDKPDEDSPAPSSPPPATDPQTTTSPPSKFYEGPVTKFFFLARKKVERLGVEIKEGETLSLDARPPPLPLHDILSLPLNVLFHPAIKFAKTNALHFLGEEREFPRCFPHPPPFQDSKQHTIPLDAPLIGKESWSHADCFFATYLLCMEEGREVVGYLTLCGERVYQIRGTYYSCPWQFASQAR